VRPTCWLRWDTAIGALLIFVSLTMLCVVLAGCGQASGSHDPSADTPEDTAAVRATGESAEDSRGAEEITVSAASSLRKAFTELSAAYQAQTGVRVLVNTAASGVLQKQIEGGAPVDVFASASAKQVEDLLTRGLVVPESVRAFAGNTIVLVVPREAGAVVAGFTDLVSPEVSRIATGNPKTAPHGTASVQTLESLGLMEAVEDKMVYTENVAQTYDYVARGEVDAAILFLSEVVDDDAVRIVAKAPVGSYEAISYVMAVTEATEEPEAAAAFEDLVLSEEGQAVLGSHGFTPARGSAGAIRPSSAGALSEWGGLGWQATGRAG
jgi:molybdate transport system substrate-binding protein